MANCAFLSSVREDRKIPDEIPPGERDAWWKAFVKSEEGQEWLDDLHRMYHVAVEGDGRFTAFNVRPGRYELKAELDRAPEEAGLSNRIFGEYTGIVEVPPVDGDAPSIRDLGELPLRVYATLNPGDPMPEVPVHRHDGQPVDWAAYRGRYLLLCLWWPLDDIHGEIPKALNDLKQRLTDRENLTVLALTMDGQWAAAKYLLRRHKPAWTLNYLLEEDSPGLAAAFGVRNSSLFLFAPDGTLATGGMAPQDVAECLRRVLKHVA
jgi:peroxiredoxin